MKTLPRPAAAPAWSALDAAQDQLVLGHYRLLEPLGSGGHGSVWIARDERDGRRVAVKRIPLAPGDTQERARILREGRAAARLAHPAIVALHEAGDDAGAHYLVSELVEGRSLAWCYAERSLDDRRVLEVGCAVASALSHAHERGVVHRDVKPANVIVAARPPAAGSSPAKLTDFGVARLSGEAPLTRSGDVVGTLAYMAPEQAEGRDAGPAADLYSLALTLYEGLAGHNPLRGETVAATARLVGGPVPPLGRLRPDLDAGLCAALDRALAPEAAARGTIAQLRAALDRALDPSSPAVPEAGATVADGGGALLAFDGGPTVRVAPPAGPLPTPVRRRTGPRPAIRAKPRPRARRLASALATGALCGAALPLVSGEHPRTAVSATVAALAAVVAATSTSVGWLLLGLGAIGWLGAIGHPGAAFVLAAGLVPVAALLERRPWLWSAPSAAPALATVGLGFAAPALAGRIGGGLRSRAALGALSYWWVALAEAFSGRRLVLGQPSGVHALATWQGSIGGALHHALIPLCSDPRLLAGAGLWALFAAVLPWIVRGRLGPERAIAAAVWAAALALAGIAIAAHLGTPRPPAPLAAWALGAVLAAAAPRLPRRSHRSAGVP